MRNRHRFFTHLSTVLFFLLLSFAGAPSPAAAQTVNVLGCVEPGVEIGCLIITDLKTNKNYNVGSANPRPDPARNLVIRLKGQISGGVSFCQQGTILNEITWSYTKRSCEPAK
jgi:hypothetical protein